MKLTNLIPIALAILKDVDRDAEDHGYDTLRYLLTKKKTADLQVGAATLPSPSTSPHDGTAS